jgi:hypothetical protein
VRFAILFKKFLTIKIRGFIFKYTKITGPNISL